MDFPTKVENEWDVNEVNIKYHQIEDNIRKNILTRFNESVNHWHPVIQLEHLNLRHSIEEMDNFYVENLELFKKARHGRLLLLNYFERADCAHLDAIGWYSQYIRQKPSELQEERRRKREKEEEERKREEEEMKKDPWYNPEGSNMYG